ncbi:hypothetical protein HGRIS_000839 [Hohenbuehelia grisea]|uniref:Secreted protein n=1 Tax=Hohenbuehelia grisea TaxID=104357 RepID=A0ABR3IPY1_9AGAR
MAFGFEIIVLCCLHHISRIARSWQTVFAPNFFLPPSQKPTISMVPTTCLSTRLRPYTHLNPKRQNGKLFWDSLHQDCAQDVYFLWEYKFTPPFTPHHLPVQRA